MKLSSLFKHKAYAFGQPNDTEQDCVFAETVLKKIRPNFKVQKISLAAVCDDYDIFHILNNKDIFYKLKISLSDPQNVLKKEVTALRSLGATHIPKYICRGNTKVGEEVDYLLTQAVQSESIRNMGRSVLAENIDQFFANYFSFAETKPVRAKYIQNLDAFCEKLTPENQLPEESLNFLKGYTDFNLCKEFFLTLQSEIKDYQVQLEEVFKYKCHASLDLDSIFYNNHFFYLDLLDQVCMGHPYVDFVDLILDSGFLKENDIPLFDKFCSTGGLVNDRELYFTIFELQIRKKLGELLLNYIREVYLYDSYRYDKIIEIADIFSHLYERFCIIPTFKENREFIMKTICEPIFGVKA
jgi:hypothetical protein